MNHVQRAVASSLAGEPWRQNVSDRSGKRQNQWCILRSTTTPPRMMLPAVAKKRSFDMRFQLSTTNQLAIRSFVAIEYAGGKEEYSYLFHRRLSLILVPGMGGCTCTRMIRPTQISTIIGSTPIFLATTLLFHSAVWMDQGCITKIL